MFWLFGCRVVEIDSDYVPCCFVCFFFQAEDGIRDLTVTGVQTCALPISSVARRDPPIKPAPIGELRSAPRSPRMLRGKSAWKWRGYESKNDCIDSGVVLCRSGSVLRRRRIYGHLEAERGQIEDGP